MRNLPENLRRKIVSFERLLLLFETLFCASAMLASAIAPLFILFVADRFADTPRALRTVLLAAALALCACTLWNWLRHWVLRRRSYSELAVVIQRRFGKLGDRLQSAVELSEDKDCSAFQSEELRQAALRQVASDAERHDFGKAVDKLRTAKISIVSALLLVMVALLAKFAAPALLNCVGRFLNPLGDVPRFTFVVPENLPGRITVPVSEPFDLVLRLSERSIHRPDYANARLNGGSFLSAMSDGSYSFRFEGIAAPSRIFLRAGDWHAAMDAVPVYRPAPEEITASIQYPEYISKTEDILVPGSTLRILDGASFTLSGRFSRALGTIAASYESRDLATRLDSDTFKIEEKMDAMDSAKVRLLATDIHGIGQKLPTVIKVETFKDKAPIADISGIARSVAILHDETTEMVLTAEDDYGLDSASLDIRIFTRKDDWEEENRVRKDMKVPAGPPLDFEAKTLLSPRSLGVGPGRLMVLKLAARDRLPGREESVSAEKYIYVLTDEEHFSLVVEKLRDIAGKMQNLRGAEIENLLRNKLLSDSAEEKISGQEGDEESSRIARDEDANADVAEKLCEEAAETLKEALKNQSFDVRMAEKWTALFSKLADLASKQFKESTKTLRNASESKTGRKGSLDDAADIQEDIVRRLDEMLQDAEASLSDTVAGNFASRLRKEAENEKNLQAQLKTTLPRSAGMTRENADSGTLAMLDGHTSFHSGIRRSVLEIRSDMSAVSRRLPLQAYGLILSDMDTEKIEKILAENEQCISENKLSDALARCKRMEEKLGQWAELLDALSKRSGQSCESSATKLPMELVIQMMRALLGETERRKDTRELDSRKPHDAKQLLEGTALSGKQDRIRDILSDLGAKYGADIPGLRQALEKVGLPMTDAAVLLAEGNTGEETIAAETEAIEIMAAMLSGMTGQSAMMGMMANAMAGKNPGFGMTADSTAENSPVNGDSHRANPDTRKADKGFRASNFDIPARFRPFYESYIRKMEEEQ